ncbi:hypothetical protein [Brazilian marseillevirus]|uniref:hypothetical protein n=1 Tax=Brazilian marseillevirus TaxID=1813599 RepID=UPI000780B5AF|nr:hypothetical protein A3303_gp404 [Brazilian marseillevirus]AMQ10912.1 hypothetical protein [Brazilian marseillevirus]
MQKGLDVRGRRHGWFERGPKREDVEMYDKTLKEMNKTPRTEKRFLELEKLAFSLSKKGKQESFFVHGTIRKFHQWSLDGRLWQKRYLEHGKVCKIVTFQKNGIVAISTERGNKVTHKKDGNVVLKEVREGDIKKFAKYDDKGNIKYTFAKRGDKFLKDEVVAKEEFSERVVGSE